MTMLDDDIIRELWRAKAAVAARYGNDVQAIVRALRKKQADDKRQVVAPPRREAPVAKP